MAFPDDVMAGQSEDVTRLAASIDERLTALEGATTPDPSAALDAFNLEQDAIADFQIALSEGIKRNRTPAQRVAFFQHMQSKAEAWTPPQEGGA